MKKMIYKILLYGLFIITMFTTETYNASDFTYTLDSSGNATITSYNGSASNLTIPSKIDGHDVIAIGDHAFDESRTSTNCRTIKNLIISEGIKKIGLLAFAKCPNLETVKLPESLTSIDMQAFIQCEKLRSINIPSKINGIPNSTFQETGFTEFNIPRNVKSIANRSLGICPNLKKVRVYSTDITFESGVFEYGSSSLVLYGYEGSTTQRYAQQNGIEFKLLSDEVTTVAVKSVTLNKTTLSLIEGNSETLTATVSPSNATDKTLAWNSNNSDVAVVKNGRVTAKGAGTATITVTNTASGKKASCTVTVTRKDVPDVPSDILVSSITLNETSWLLTEGSRGTLTATVLPNNATDKTLVWTSSNPNIATVENGKVTAISPGNTTITVSNTDGTIKASCNLIVLENKPEETSKPEEDYVVNEPTLRPNKSDILMSIFISTVVIILSVSYILYRKFNNN